MGFGHHHLVHEKGLFGMSADRPVTITVVDAETKIREVIPEVQALVQEGLILLLSAARAAILTFSKGTDEQVVTRPACR